MGVSKVGEVIAQLVMVGILWEISVLFFHETPSFVEMVILVYVMSIQYGIKIRGRSK
jgi:hypothetical protein